MGREVLLGIAILHPAVRRSGTEKHMKRNHMTLAATTVAALLFLLTLGASSASADSFILTSCHVSGGCGTATSFGTVALTQVGTSTVNVVVSLSGGNRFVETGAGGKEFFLFNGSLSGSTITTIATVPGGVVPGGLSGFTNLSPVHTGGAGDFTASVECTTFSNCNGGSAPTVTGLTFTVTNATVAQLETKNASGNFFAADILLANNGKTGVVDANAKTPTVPDGGRTLMLLGGGLVGLEILCRKFRV